MRALTLKHNIPHLERSILNNNAVALHWQFANKKDSTCLSMFRHPFALLLFAAMLCRRLFLATAFLLPLALLLLAPKVPPKDPHVDHGETCICQRLKKNATIRALGPHGKGHFFLITSTEDVYVIGREYLNRHNHVHKPENTVNQRWPGADESKLTKVLREPVRGDYFVLLGDYDHQVQLTLVQVKVGRQLLCLQESSRITWAHFKVRECTPFAEPLGAVISSSSSRLALGLAYDTKDGVRSGKICITTYITWAAIRPANGSYCFEPPPLDDHFLGSVISGIFVLQQRRLLLFTTTTLWIAEHVGCKSSSHTNKLSNQSIAVFFNCANGSRNGSDDTILKVQKLLQGEWKREEKIGHGKKHKTIRRNEQKATLLWCFGGLALGVPLTGYLLYRQKTGKDVLLEATGALGKMYNYGGGMYSSLLGLLRENEEEDEEDEETPKGKTKKKPKKKKRRRSSTTPKKAKRRRRTPSTSEKKKRNLRKGSKAKIKR